MSRQMKINGVPVVDAKKPAKIKIFKQDIDKSTKKDPGMCAAAVAALRTFSNVNEARVHLKRIYLRVGKGPTERWLRYETPTALRQEIISFDRGGKFEPGDYQLKVSAPSERLGVDKRPRPRTTKVPLRSTRYVPIHVANVRSRLRSGKQK